MNATDKTMALIADYFGVDQESLKPDTELRGFLGADSLDIIDLQMSLEESFKVEIPDDEIVDLKTVGQLCALMEAKAA